MHLLTGFKLLLILMFTPVCPFLQDVALRHALISDLHSFSVVFVSLSLFSSLCTVKHIIDRLCRFKSGI